MELDRCRICRGQIRWLPTIANAVWPFDAEPARRWEINPREAFVVKREGGRLLAENLGRFDELDGLVLRRHGCFSMLVSQRAG